MAAPACAPDLEDGELFLPKDIFPDDDELLLWRGPTGEDEDDHLAVMETEGPDATNAGFDLNNLAAKLAALGLGLSALPPRSKCRAPGAHPSLLSPPAPVVTRCGADNVRFEGSLPALSPRKQSTHPQPPWVLGPRADDALVVLRRQKQQRPPPLFAARASALGVPFVELDGAGCRCGCVGSAAVGEGFTPAPSLLLPTGGRGFTAAVTQGRNGNAASWGIDTPLVARRRVPPYRARGFPVSLPRRRCGGTGVFLPRVSSSASAAPASMMNNNAELHQQILRYQHNLQGSSPALFGFSKNRDFLMMIDRDCTPYPALAAPPAPAVDWSSY